MGRIRLVTDSDPLLELGKSTDLPAFHFLIFSCGAGVHPASEFLPGVLYPRVSCFLTRVFLFVFQTVSLCIPGWL